MRANGSSDTADVPTWGALFERAPEHISEATIREMLAAHRKGDEKQE